MSGLALSTLHSEDCPDCGATVVEYEVEQDALFLHGGYGATNRTVQILCPECGWVMVREVSEIRPPKATT